MRKWLLANIFGTILIIIILLLAGFFVYASYCNNNALHLINYQQDVIEKQQQVIEQYSGVDIPEGSYAEPQTW